MGSQDTHLRTVLPTVSKKESTVQKTNCHFTTSFFSVFARNAMRELVKKCLVQLKRCVFQTLGRFINQVGAFSMTYKKDSRAFTFLENFVDTAVKACWFRSKCDIKNNS